MKKTLVAVFAGAVLTLATAPAAFAQTDTTTPPTETTTTSSETSTTSSSPTTTTTTTTTPSPTSSEQVSPIETTKLSPQPQQKSDLRVDDAEPVTTTPEPPYQDNIGHGFVGLGGEGILVIQCAAGAPGNVSTANLTVTGGPDQDEADSRLWNYSVRVVTPPTTPTTPFSWTCDGQEGHGVVEFEQVKPPTTTATPTSSSPTSTTTAPTSSTAPITTANPGGSAPQGPQVKVSPKGGVETGFGGTAR